MQAFGADQYFSDLVFLKKEEERALVMKKTTQHRAQGPEA